MELLLARSQGDGVEELVVDGDWAVVRPGPGDLDSATVRLLDLYVDSQRS